MMASMTDIEMNRYPEETDLPEWMNKRKIFTLIQKDIEKRQLSPTITDLPTDYVGNTNGQQIREEIY